MELLSFLNGSFAASKLKSSFQNNLIRYLDVRLEALIDENQKCKKINFGQ